LNRVAAEYGLGLGELVWGRAYGLKARSVSMWVLWHLGELSLRQIGTLFDGLDYAAVAQRIRRLECDRESLRTAKRLLQKCQNV